MHDVSQSKTKCVFMVLRSAQNVHKTCTNCNAILIKIQFQVIASSTVFNRCMIVYCTYLRSLQPCQVCTLLLGSPVFSVSMSHPVIHDVTSHHTDTAGHHKHPGSGAGLHLDKSVWFVRALTC